MSKRKHEESAAPIEPIVDTPPQKKSKKEKDGKKSKEKKEKKSIVVDTPIHAQSPASDDEAEALAKAERKALKKAKKQAEKDARKSGDATNAEKLSKDERKALKKARKPANKESESPADSESLTKATKKAGKEAKIAAKTWSTNSTTTHANGVSKAQSGSTKTLGTVDAEAFFKANEITIDDDASITSAALSPITDFAQLPITDNAERAPFKSFKTPTPIQAAAWPYLLAGRDVVGVAETGSGKTWAFGVPCIRYIKELPAERSGGIKAVIVSPTRELALQIQEQLEKVAGPAKLNVVCVYGGANKYEQQALIKKANIVVATPGRLNDFLSDGSANLSNAQYVVLDEADRMLDKGFEEDVRKIISATSKDRQTLMFTATWPPSVRELAATFTKTPVKIFIGDNATGELRANTRVQQIVEVIDPNEKNNRLIQLLREHQSGKKKNDRILVFCLYKKEADRVFYFLSGKGFSVAGIHGDMSQDKRIASLDRFKKGESSILVATDVAARGLDIPAVKVVINVTFPLTAEDYVHRIGRTGRAGQDGIAVTLFTEHDKSNSGSLVNVLRAANQPIPEALLKFGTTVKKKEHSAYGAFYKDVDMTKKATKITFD